MIIKIFSGENRAEVQNLVLGVLEEHGFKYDPKKDSDLGNIEKYYLQKGGVFYTGTVGEEVIGTGAVRRVSEEKCEIKRVYVKKEHRGKGCGKKLFLKALEFARNNYEIVELKTDKTLNAAINMYHKHGFSLIREDEEAGIMYLRLSH